MTYNYIASLYPMLVLVVGQDAGEEKGNRKNIKHRYLGHSQNVCAIFVTWEPNVKKFHIIAENIPNNSGVNVHTEVLMFCACQS